MTHYQLIKELHDLFDAAICDSIDIDWRTGDGAAACVKALFDAPDLLAELARSIET
jgi:hypothetical protein